jgi:atrial natriuretic peptide receptor A
VRRVRDALIPPYRPRVPFDAVPPELYAIMLRCWSELPTYRFDAELLRNELQRVPGNKSGNLMDDLLKRMEKYAKNLEELVNERTSAFMDEKKRSEDLLYQMLPRYNNKIMAYLTHSGLNRSYLKKKRWISAYQN